MEHNGGSKLVPNGLPQCGHHQPRPHLGSTVQFPSELYTVPPQATNNDTILNQITAQQKETSTLTAGLLPFGEDYRRRNSYIG